MIPLLLNGLQTTYSSRNKTRGPYLFKESFCSHTVVVMDTAQFCHYNLTMPTVSFATALVHAWGDPHGSLPLLLAHGITRWLTGWDSVQPVMYHLSLTCLPPSLPLSRLTPGSDFHNGIVGFGRSSLVGQTLDEDSENRTAELVLQRQENR